MKTPRHGLLALFMSFALVTACSAAPDGGASSQVSEDAQQEVTTQAVEETSDAVAEGADEEPSSEHGPMASDLIAMLDAAPELKALVEKSLAKAAAINPDPVTNPAQNLDELIAFCDWATTCRPWDVLEAREGNLYDRIDQSVDYFWFLVDQPLEELEGLGYYYPSLQYHEPIASWCKKYAEGWGSFLSSPESWSDEDYEIVKADPRFNMDKGWYADSNVWTSFNDWFSRKLIDPSVRPIAESTVVAPADSKPQGVWSIAEDGMLEMQQGTVVKSKRLVNIHELIGPESAYADAFDGGTFTHTFLDVNDYHRYHFPVSGTIVEVAKIPGVNAAGGITVWDAESGRYVLEDAVPGWQMIETRDCVIIDTHDHGLVAVLPIGMSQICSCNWEDTVKVGAEVEKGDPMGYFLFGGSDICMVFQKGVDVDFLATEDGNGGYRHLLMGEAYADLS